MPAVLTAWMLSLQPVAAADAGVNEIRRQAVAFEHGRDGIGQDYRRASELYCQAALQGDAEAAYALGFMYFNGRGLRRDAGLAMHWFARAADAGDRQAANMLKTFRDVQPVADVGCKSETPVFAPAVTVNPQQQRVAAWVNRIAPGYGIDPQLVMAVIKAESAFNAGALSARHAQGLMQLIPETAERFGVKDVWNPQQNLNGGIAYLHWLLRHFQGRVDLAVAAYNAGEAAVERYRGIPPFAETRNYVKQIQSAYPSVQHPIPPEQVRPVSMPEDEV